MSQPPTTNHQPPFDSSRWSPLHCYRIVSPGNGEWRICNDTTGEWAPRTFKSRTEALDALVDGAVARYKDPFEGLDAGVMELHQTGGLSTQGYGARFWEASPTSTARAADHLQRLQRHGLATGTMRRGGYRFWTLTPGGRTLVELIERYRCRATPSS